MDWQTRLVALYCKVCDDYFNGLCEVAQRISPNYQPVFTDQEVLTIYYSGIQEGLKDKASIYRHASTYWADFFPNLPKYKQFSRRVGRLGNTMIKHVEILTETGQFNGALGFLMDSMPIILSKNINRKTERILDQEASVGYCSTKKLYYYGVKIHVIGERKLGSVPSPIFVGTTPANVHDLTAFKSIAPDLREMEIYCDKAYCCQEFQNDIAYEQGTLIATPIKKVKNCSEGAFEKLHNYFISHIRQPIESYFSYLSRKTGIQDGSRIRSLNGLLAHVYGRLASTLINV